MGLLFLVTAAMLDSQRPCWILNLAEILHYEALHFDHAVHEL